MIFFLCCGNILAYTHLSNEYLIMFGNSKSKIAELTTSYNNSIISNSVVLDGNIVSLGTIRFDGKMTGRIICKDKVIIGPEAVVKGDIIAQHVEIGGTVIGTVEATETLVLKANCDIKGDLISKKLIIEDNAKFDGNCKMSNLQYPESLEEIDRIISDKSEQLLLNNDRTTVME